MQILAIICLILSTFFLSQGDYPNIHEILAKPLNLSLVILFVFIVFLPNFFSKIPVKIKKITELMNLLYPCVITVLLIQDIKFLIGAYLFAVGWYLLFNLENKRQLLKP